MADSADHSNPTERYAAIEQAYCADQWGEVIDQGQSLLEEIPRTRAAVPEGLKERVQLLMAHAHLYGFNEQDIAEDLYSDVLHSKAELTLRQIAEQGLQQCALPKPVSPAVIEAGTEGEPSPGTATGATAAAPAAAPSQAASQRQAPTSLQTSTGELSGPDPSSQNRKLTADADRAAALGSETALAPASPEPATTLVAANVNSATINPPATGSLAMPWLVTGALAATTAAAAASAAPTPWAPPATQAATPEPTTPSAAQQEVVAAAGEALAPPVQQKTAQRTQPTAPEVTLIPEVVDEPELFDVHQADPRLAEELDLTVMEPEPPIAMTAAEIVELPSTSLSAAAAIASAAILGTTTGPAAEAKTPTPLTWQEKQTIKPESGAESAPGHQLSAAPAEPQSLLSLTGEALDTAAEPDVLFELFRNPPAPVEEEDPELLLGLLRVLVSAESAGDGG